MRFVRSLLVLAAVVALTACGPKEDPTPLPVPEGAKDVKQVQLADGRAHQTYFTMRVRFPSNPALEHYSKTIKEPWLRCEWIPEWQHFLDGTVNPNRTIHQQAYMWVNPAARRTLMVASRYYSSQDCVGNPENDDQQVTVVEYFGENIEDTISTLKLRCPADRPRSNSTPHPDALQAFYDMPESVARAGERER